MEGALTQALAAEKLGVIDHMRHRRSHCDTPYTVAQ
jgi:hypothetical protein